MTVPSVPTILIRSNISQGKPSNLINTKTGKTYRKHARINNQTLERYRIIKIILNLRGRNIKHNAADKQHHNGMNGRPEEEGDEVTEVAVADAGSYPWAVVVVHFNANVALAAVE